MFHTPFEEMGIPPGYGFKQLLFQPNANVLILQTCSAKDNWRPERLYFRHINWDKYRPIGEPDDLVSQESPFVHPSKPLLAFTSIRHSFSVDHEGKERHSGDWDSLQVVSLETGSVTQSITYDSLQLPSGFTRGWIPAIVAFGEAGLFVIVGLSKTDAHMGYFVAELDATQALKPIVEFPAVFM